MRFYKSISFFCLLCAGLATAFPKGTQSQFSVWSHPDVTSEGVSDGAPKGVISPTGCHNVSAHLFAELEEFSRIVDIAYCVGVTGTGIQSPFECASRCDQFPGYELVDVHPPFLFAYLF